MEKGGPEDDQRGRHELRAQKRARRPKEERKRSLEEEKKKEEQRIGRAH
jgi:hypothetical protein